MILPRFSIAAMSLVVAHCGIGFAALRHANDGWARFVFATTAGIYLLLWADFAVASARGRLRAFWLGFVVAGMTFLLWSNVASPPLEWVYRIYRHTGHPHSSIRMFSIKTIAGPVSDDTVIVDVGYGPGKIAKFAVIGTSLYPVDFLPFARIVYDLLSLLVALAGGYVINFFASFRRVVHKGDTA